MNRPGFQNDDRQRVLDASDIVRLVGEHLTLKRKGREFVAVCPFHDDHAPSMYVSPHKQIYKCFSCGAGGNIIDFVINYHKMEFREALQYLADRFGVTLTPMRRPGTGERFGASGDDEPAVNRQSVLAANATAQQFFRLILEHAEHGANARAVVERRAISPEMIKLFQLGAAPDKWDGLNLTIANKGLDPAPFVAAGLLRTRESGGQFDMFRNRLLFPILDQLGRVVAFGGRKINEQDEPKYINSPESLVFNKSATLYGLFQAGDSIRAAGRVIVTEGYMDTIACHQAGVRNVVATLGTALNAQGARVLQRLCNEVVLLFDGDEAGQRAADRAIEVFFASNLDVKIATLAAARDSGTIDAKDPDELVKQPGGVERLHDIINHATDALEYRFSRFARRTAGLSMTARATQVQEELQRLVDLGWNQLMPIRQSLILRRIASIAGVSDEVIRRSLPQEKPRRVFVPGGPGSAPTSGASSADASGAGGGAGAGPSAPAIVEHVRLRAPAEHVVACVLAEPSLASGLSVEDRALLGSINDVDDGVRALGAWLAQTLASDAGFAQRRCRDVLGMIQDEALFRRAVSVVAEIGRLTDDDPERVKSQFEACLVAARDARAVRRARGEADRATDPASAAARIEEMRRLRAAGVNAPRPAPRPGSA